MTESLVNKPFKERLQDGKEFEDFVAVELYRAGMPFVAFASRRFQWEFGESFCKIEVKHDRLWQDTRRLFIEIKERRNTDGVSQWRNAGIYDETNPWLYVIGGEARLWIMATTILRLLHKSKKYEEKQTKTSEGFVMPLGDADKYAIATIDPKPF